MLKVCCYRTEYVWSAGGFPGCLAKFFDDNHMPFLNRKKYNKSMADKYIINRNLCNPLGQKTVLV